MTLLVKLNSHALQVCFISFYFICYLYLLLSSVSNIPQEILSLSQHLSLPRLPEYILWFLYRQSHSELDIPLDDIPIKDCPIYHGQVFVYPSAVSTFYAPSDLFGIGGMLRECICSVDSWRDGAEQCDCVFVVHDESLLGFCGLHVARVRLFFKIKHYGVTYPCALVIWFSAIDDKPCKDTRMWMVKPDVDSSGERNMSVIHLDSILRGAHLIGISGDERIPQHIDHTNSLDAFQGFYVNKYIHYHAHEIAF